MSESAPPDPPTMSPRQTLTYLQKLFETYGLEAKSKLGQNFLIDLNLLDLIVRTAELGPGGRGAGSRHRHRVADGADWPIRPGRCARSRSTPTLPPVRASSCVASGERAVRLRRLPGEQERAEPARCSPRGTKPSTKAGLHAAEARGEPALRDRHAAHQQPAHRPRRSIERMVVMVQWEIAERLRRAWARRTTTRCRCSCRASPTWRWCGRCCRRTSTRGRRSIRRSC